MKSSLDISDEALAMLADGASRLVNEYFATVSKRRVFPDTSGGKLTERLGAALPTEGEDLARLLDDCRAIIDHSRHNGHPRFLAYVASPSTAPGAYADLIASALNPSVTSWRSSPAATEVEHIVVRWLGSMIGYGDDSRGLLTGGGSLANLTALFIAQRAKSSEDLARTGLWHSARPMTIYASEQIHMSIPKAADVLGIGRDQVRTVACDDRFRVNVSSLRQKIEADLASGFKPFCIVASAGTVNTGAVDDMHEIAAVAKQYDLWYHVDGAYGALGALDDRKRSLFAGIELADSVSLDPHKWLFTPVDCGCLLFRDEQKARAAFSANEADYIKVHGLANEEAFAFWDYGIELSRRFRALKVWLTLRYFGMKRIAGAIAENNALAEYMAERVNEASDFELLAPVELSICCFRCVPPGFRKDDQDDLRLNELNATIMHRVQRGGRAYLSNATIAGKFALRACITNFRTTRHDIDEILDTIRETGRSIK